MGAACCKGATDQTSSAKNGSGGSSSGGTLKVMFDRIDKEKKGYISRKNLQDMMVSDDKMGFPHFQGKDVDRILAKYGSNDQMNFMEFQSWWNSTYTTYGDNDLERIVDEVDEEEANKVQHMDTIEEASIPLPKNQHISNVAVSRS